MDKITKDNLTDLAEIVSNSPTPDPNQGDQNQSASEPQAGGSDEQTVTGNEGETVTLGQ